MSQTLENERMRSTEYNNPYSLLRDEELNTLI